ncbi:P-loop containing nucleoside triphosphate hydrolase protein [Tothia fuscella]|uniref:P-loop containing nucleoside triphosphate hydrolase protein n=1 Tax=Tothia fuscella TaxID=1048955 RepID=A0A9P4NYB9_9PEZI|nr:P-loop containing nucleoside triphosphate hydrolase protein [Tothia fuscella]
MDERLKAEILADAKQYLNPGTFEQRLSAGLTYRRGYLFYGPPGTGKTSFCKALAHELQLDLYLLHMPYLHSDKQLATLFRDLPSRCILLFDDIDTSVFNYKDRAVSISALLNAIDGANSKEGRILIMTTNYVEKLDKRLIRTGRIDKIW